MPTIDITPQINQTNNPYAPILAPEPVRIDSEGDSKDEKHEFEDNYEFLDSESWVASLRQEITDSTKILSEAEAQIEEIYEIGEEEDLEYTEFEDQVLTEFFEFENLEERNAEAESEAKAPLEFPIFHPEEDEEAALNE